jgi:penicillin-insensitive murein endopeptidase
VARRRARPGADGVRRRRWAASLGVVLLVGGAVVWFGNDALRAVESGAPSVSHGTAADGRLEHGKRLPSAGPNFRTYSRLGSLLGRTAVHERVRAALLDAFAALEASHPQKRFVYGETGWPSGGRIRPHVTHRNGLSVDLMVPVMDAEGRSVPLPTRPWALWGYRLELDRAGALGDLRTDYEALAALLRALDAAARTNGLRVRHVIYDEPLQPRLFAADPGLRDALRFSTVPAWVRHDEHVHVDFALDVDGAR